MLARALWREGYNDHLAGHITVNLGDGTLLCNPWLLTWAELRPSQVLRIDLEGRVVEGDWPVPLGIPLHLELHKLREDVGWAVHNHPLFGTVWADLGELPPILDQSSALGGGTLVVVDEYEGPVNDASSARRAVEKMGDASMALLAGHGVFVLGGSARAVHQRAVALEQRCQHAWYARAAGGAGRLPGPAGLHRPRGPERRRGLHRLLGGGGPRRAGGRPRPARRLARRRPEDLAQLHRHRGVELRVGARRRARGRGASARTTWRGGSGPAGGGRRRPRTTASGRSGSHVMSLPAFQRFAPAGRPAGRLGLGPARPGVVLRARPSGRARARRPARAGGPR